MTSKGNKMTRETKAQRSARIYRETQKLLDEATKQAIAKRVAITTAIQKQAIPRITFVK